jgi:hypothetical protein
MTHQVIITTPVPSLEEFGKSLGLSKARQKSIMQIMMDGNHRSVVTACKVRKVAPEAAPLTYAMRAASSRTKKRQRVA